MTGRRSKVKAPGVVECPRCGQRGNERPGLKLSEYERLGAVFLADQPVPTPQRLTCLACGHSWAIPRDSVEVRRP